ncbi:MAG: sodium:proton antiporter [Chloroflexota bacterium]|nr:sodium:proton antiporter [Chloroflexota bacterium]
MTLVLSVTIAILFGSGVYLVLKEDLIRLAVGMVLITNAANLFIMSAGLSRGEAPIYPLPEGGRVADPLVQAMVLTAIVIGFGVSALLLSLVYRVYMSHLSLDLDDLSAAEEREEASMEAERTRQQAEHPEETEATTEPPASDRGQLATAGREGTS